MVSSPRRVWLTIKTALVKEKRTQTSNKIYLSLELRVQAVFVYLLTVAARDCSEKTA